MLTTYTLVQNLDIYTLTNTGPISITYSLKVVDGCDNIIDILDGVLPAGESTIFDLSGRVDGIYTITFTDGVDTTTATIRKYSQLLNSAILATENYLCRSTSNSCTIYDETETGLNTLIKLVYHFSLYRPSYDAYLSAIFADVNCLISTEAHCLLTNEAVKGVSENTLLNKKLIALYYLTFYFAELKATAEEDLADLEVRFKTSTIFTCISALGIDINLLKQNIADMANLTITTAAHVNSPPSNIDDGALSVGNRTTNILTIDLFNQGYTDPDGDAMAAIRIDTLPAAVSGVLKLDGVPVIAGDIITVTDIVAGLLTYVAPIQDAADTDIFSFSVSDEGSGQFTS